jgi:hypothetical protein
MENRAGGDAFGFVHEPTDETRRLVESSSGLGLPHESIAVLVGIDDKTLRKYYRHELDMGKAKANGQIAKTLYSKAVAGDTTSLIWWTKSQMRWSETVRNEMTGADGKELTGIQVTFVKPVPSRVGGNGLAPLISFVVELRPDALWGPPTNN